MIKGIEQICLASRPSAATYETYFYQQVLTSSNLGQNLISEKCKTDYFSDLF